MEEYKLSQIAEITSGKVIGEDRICYDISHDSRNISSGEGVLFIALAGQRYNGHSYIKNSYDRRIKAFMVSTDFNEFELYPDASFIIVESPLKALQELAAHNRALYKGALLAITGSSGKTIVKEIRSEERRVGKEC